MNLRCRRDCPPLRRSSAPATSRPLHSKSGSLWNLNSVLIVNCAGMRRPARRGDERMNSARARHVRRVMRRRRRRARRSLMLVSSGALAAAVTTAISVASLSGIDVAAAAADKARSIADLFAQRSPGERTAAVLTKTKHKYSAVLAERSVPEVPVIPPLLAEALLPAQPLPELPELELAQAGPPIPSIFIPGGAVIFPPGPPGPPGPPPPPPPPPPPAVPEPGTWATMIVGFAIAGMQLRRRRAVEPAISLR